MKRKTAMALVLLMVLSIMAVCVQADSYWSCESCGKQNEINSNFCISCGERRKADSIGWICFMCAAENETSAQLCSSCGIDKESFAKNIREGRIIKFGHYEQDGNLRSNDEPIEWMVLEVDHNSKTALVLSVKCLAAKPYQAGNENTKYVVWADSELRNWLNNEFFDAAFTMGEQQFIALTTVTTEDINRNDGGPDTTDQVFLLSKAEVARYFPGETKLTYFYNGKAKDTQVNMNRCALPTPYAKAQGCYTFDEGKAYEGMAEFEGYSYWWLRSPGESNTMASTVYFNGRLGNFGSVSDATRGIRPAMWIKLDPSGTEAAWICRECGKNNPADGNFCMKCGTKRG